MQMKKMWKNSVIRFGLLMLLTMLVFAFSGCGQNGADLSDKEIFDDVQIPLTDEEVADLEEDAGDEELAEATKEELLALTGSETGDAEVYDDPFIEEVYAAEADGEDGEELTVEENGTYTSKDEVALYIHEFGHLPSNYITKKEAKKLGWESSKGNLDKVAPGKSIGGDHFGNYEGNLPEKKGRTYTECDINYESGRRGAERIIFSDDGLIFYTDDHYNTFEQLY